MSIPPGPAPRRILAAVGGIYTAQSLIGGLTFVSVPTILRDRGVGLEQIGLVSLVMLPWALKFLWAPWVEGLRRPRLVITIGEFLAALILLGIGLLGGGDASSLLLCLAVLAMVAASVDIACDSFLISHLDTARLGSGNVAQVGGGYLGLVFGGGLFTLIVASWGWMAACGVLAAILAALSLPMALMAEPRTASHHHPSLRDALKRPAIRAGILLTLCFESGGRVAMALGGPLLIDHGAPLSVVGAVNGLAGVAAGLAGAALGGLAVRRLGSARAVRTLFLLHLASLSLLILTVWRGADWTGIVPALLLENTVMAAGFVTLYARLMEKVSPRQPGVDFTLFQCTSVVAAVAGGMAGGWLAGQSGYTAALVTAAMLTAMGAALARPLLSERRAAA